MMKSTDNQNQAGDLPSFLDASTDKDADVSELAAEGQPEAECDEQEFEQEHDGEYEQGAELDDQDVDEGEHDELPFDDLDDDEEEEGDAESESYAARQPIARRSRYRRRRSDTHKVQSGAPAMFTGLLLTVAAFVTCVVPAAAAAVHGIAVDPQIVLLLGIALFAIGAGQRRGGGVQQRIEQLDADRREGEDELYDALAELLGQQNPAGGAIEGGDMQRVLLSLQRQDEKINNLTKAIKMYGKPLMEIAGQGTDLAGSVAQVRALVEGNRESARLANHRIEERIDAAAKSTDLGDLPAQIEKLHVSLAAVTQRLEDSEVRKSLVRLEDSGKQMQQELQELQRGDRVREASEQLQERLNDATKGLNDGIAQLRDGNLGDLETTVREIQREVAGLATGVAQIQAAVKSQGKVAVAAAAVAAPASAPAGSSTAAPTKAEGEDVNGDSYKTGKRNSGGKNVLGAIAKLKKMKG